MNQDRAESTVAASPAAESGDVLLQVNHLKKYFPVSGNLPGKKKQYVRAVDDVSLQVRVGRTVGIRLRKDDDGPHHFAPALDHGRRSPV